MYRMMAILLFSAIILAACQGAVPPAQSTTQTAPGLPTTVQAIHTPTISPSPAGIETPIPFGGIPSIYGRTTLKAWDAPTAWSIYQEIATDFPQPINDSPYNGYTETDARITLLREIVARYPDSPEAKNAGNELVYQMAKDQSSIEPFQTLMEQTLNDNADISIDLDSLTLLINDIFGVGRFELKQILPATNILADGQPGWAMEIWTDAYTTAVFALSGHPGSYQIKNPIKNWEYVPGWDEKKILVQDLNVDGVPEITVWNILGGIGMTHYCGNELLEYQWDGHEFSNLTPNIFVDANTLTADCLDFTFIPHDNNPMTIMTGKFIGSRGDYEDPVSVIVYKMAYEWNGNYFSLAGQTIKPPEMGMESDYHAKLRLLQWADLAGPTNDLAYQMLPSLLAENDPILLERWSEGFGPAYLDYFRFKLGTWYAMRGQQSKAIALLTQVRDHPAAPEYKFAAQLADIFLIYYPNESAYQGCNAVNQSLDFSSFGSESLDLDKIRSQWGYADPLWWSMTAYGSWSGPSGRDDAANVCPLTSAFRLSLRGQSFSNLAQVENWLANQGIPYTGLMEGDADGDGRKDWTTLLGTGSYQNYQLWLLLNKGTSTLPLQIRDCCAETSGVILSSWGTFYPEPSGEPVNFYMLPTSVTFYRVLSHGSWTGVQVLRNNHYLFGAIYYGYEIIGNSGNQRIAVNIYTVKDYDTTPIFYSWDSLDNNLTLTENTNSEQEQLIQSMEESLFIDKDTQTAFEIINHLFSEDYPLQDSESAPTVRPYLLYLKGLAFEMAGNEQDAVTTYWQLWNDYPTHPLVYLARQKLTHTSQ